MPPNKPEEPYSHQHPLIRIRQAHWINVIQLLASEKETIDRDEPRRQRIKPIRLVQPQEVIIRVPPIAQSQRQEQEDQHQVHCWKCADHRCTG